MTESNTSKPAQSPLHWPSLIQFILSSLAAFLLLGAAVIIVIISIVQYFTRGFTLAYLTQPFMVSASLVFAGVLVLPAAWYAWKNVTSLDVQAKSPAEARNYTLTLTLLVLVVVGGALALGNWASQDNRLAWWLLPPLNIIATGLPALWVIYIGTRGLIPGMPRRQWAVFASGLVLGPLIILILELLLLLAMVILALLWIMLNPSLSNQLNGIVFRLQNAAPNTDAILKVLLPLLLNPGIIFLLFAFISVLVPMLEESLKPIGVWFLAGQKITPAQGFGYGVLSGAGFGLFENLGNTSSGGAEWALLASTRISTLLLHCFTAGLVGWALVSAWSQRRYLRLGLTYIIAIFIHGLWNGMAVLSTASSSQGLSNISIPTSLQQIGALSSYGIITLGVIVLVLYITANGILRHNARAPQPPPSPEGGGSSSLEDQTLPPGESESYQIVSDPAHSLSITPDNATQIPGRETDYLSTGEKYPDTTE
ncbi:MAG: PrsW family glutamic-type intramembrane protease [Anaerolineales bacterium]